MRVIDLNCDMGESFGNYKLGLDEEVIKYVSTANIACGYHAGDPIVMDKTVQLAKKYNVAIGAHPGFPDLMGFGRRDMQVNRTEIIDYFIYQVGALMTFAKVHKTALQHVKAHGKFGIMAWYDKEMAKASAEAVAMIDPSLIYVVVGGSQADMTAKAGEEVGLRVAREGTADRAYLPDGSLVARSKPGAVIVDVNEIEERVIRMAKEKKVVAIDGTVIDLQVDTICVHGDNPSALSIVKKIVEGLKKENVQIKPMRDFLSAK